MPFKISLIPSLCCHHHHSISQPTLNVEVSDLSFHCVFRLLKALGAPKSMRIYWAGGIPLGGAAALLPLVKEFPQFYSKEDLALPGELEPFLKKASLMAAIDHIVSEKSDVFMASHGGNMGHAIQVTFTLQVE